VTLLSSPPEVQWIALRNINLLLQKRSDILSNAGLFLQVLVRQGGKLDIMVHLATRTLT
jgi:AP-1 complex subunit beta-1